jgi:hypothetical protein
MKNKSIIYGAVLVAFVMLLSVTAVPKVNGQTLVEQDKKTEQDSLSSIINELLLSNSDITNVEEKIVWKIGNFLVDDYFNDSNANRQNVQYFIENNGNFSALFDEIVDEFQALENELADDLEDFFYDPDNPHSEDEFTSDHADKGDYFMHRANDALADVFNGDNFAALLEDDYYNDLLDDLALELEGKDINGANTVDVTGEFWEDFLKELLTILCSWIFMIDFLFFGQSTVTFGLATILCALLLFLPTIGMCYDKNPIVAAFEGFIAVMVLVGKFWSDIFNVLAKYGLFGLLCGSLLIVGTSPLWLTAAILMGLLAGIYSLVSGYSIEEHWNIISEILGDGAKTAKDIWDQIWPWHDTSRSIPKSYSKLSVMLMELADRFLRRVLSSFLSKYPSLNV